MDAFEQLEKQITSLKSQVSKLRAATDLQSVQSKLDAFMEELRLLHRGLLATLEQMIDELNAEGVKRYEGAVRAVNDNVNTQLEELKNVCSKS